MLVGRVAGFTDPAWCYDQIALVFKGPRISGFTSFGTDVVDAVGFVASFLGGLNLFAVDGKWIAQRKV